MKNKLLFAAAALGIVVAVYSAYVYSQRPPAQPPLFNPAANPYSDGIYANGIVESLQSNGENINIYPEITGPVTRVLVSEGSVVHRGDVLLTIDDSVQRATAEQQVAQAQSAAALLEELKAQPRPENLEVARAQVDLAQASLKNATDQFAKQQHASEIAPGSVSIDALDNAWNAAKIASTNFEVVQKQYALIKAGAWIYDIQSQEKQVAALTKASDASNALLQKYTIKAPIDGVVLSIGAAAGSYVSPQGAYATYTEGFRPLITMSTSQEHLEVRCYVDEILVHRLPDTEHMASGMFIRGTDISIPLTFERLQPYVSPKIELANERQERVDVRVLPVVFSFDKPRGLSLYPGQLVDVYIGRK